MHIIKLLYQMVEKKIRIIELRRNHFAEGGFYDFSGKAE